MKNLIFTIFFLGLLQPAFAQDDMKRADTYFERAFYSDAIPLYEQLLPTNKNAKLVKNLADSYYNTFDMKSAARWFGYLIDNYGISSGTNAEDELSSAFKNMGDSGKASVDESYLFKYGQSLKAIGEREKAHQVLSNYYTVRGETTELNELNDEMRYLDNVAAIGERFEIKNLAINTAASEFGAAKVDTNLVYSASRKDGNILPKVYRWNNENYLDLYAHPIARLDAGDSLSVALPGSVNSKLHEGTFAITKDRSTIYFTRNSKSRTDEKISNLKIYKAEWKNGAWRNSTSLPFNSDGFSTEHPALSADGTRLYFASDREGGFGSFDIYYVTIGKDGFYGNPVNLGKTINTDKKEQFPFLDAKDNLYFASNGHPGFGLLDVFIAEKEDDGFSAPDNLGFPVNSGYDDFSLSYTEDGKTGYFASNRPSGKGSDDIYSFTETKPLIIEDCKQFIAGILTDKTTDYIISGGKVNLVDAQGKVIKSILTGMDGAIEFTAACTAEYRVEAAKEAYESNEKSVLTDETRNEVKDASLALISHEELEAQKALALQKEKEEAEKKAIADAARKVAEEKAAEEQRILAEKQAEEKRIRDEKIAKENERIAMEKAEKERLRKVEEVIAKEEAIVKKDDRILIETEEIHFDYSLWYLRRESRERLGKVIDLMKKNPGIVLEIGTHTDIRGNKEYNRDLSQKRADSVREFLIKNEIAEDRVIAKGYGESQPIVKCETEESCSEEDHEWNRRCEMVIVAWN